METKTFTYTKNFLGNYYHWRFGEMDAHMTALAEQGWHPVNSATDPGHVKIGATIGAAALTGGLSLLLGASRTASEISITFRR